VSWAPQITVAVVTFGRGPFLPLLLDCFERQTYPHRELLLIDDSEEPSLPVALRERPYLRYHPLPTRHSVGAKRALVAELAPGELVCQWDDDDYYAPGYLERVARELETADFFSLDRWFALELGRGELLYWDTRRAGRGPGQRDALWVERNRLGYGFSFAYRRDVLTTCPPPDSSVGDDYAFARAARDAGLRVQLGPDRSGLALHLLHGSNLSSSHPDRNLGPEFLAALYPQFSLARYRAAASRCAAASPPR